MTQAMIEDAVARQAELLESLFSFSCTCGAKDAKCGCPESVWVARAKSFVRSYSLAVVEARSSTPNSSAWWSASSGRPPVPPSLSEYQDLLELTPGISPHARAQMNEYLESFLPGYYKNLGRSQNAECLVQFEYRSTIALRLYGPKD